MRPQQRKPRGDDQLLFCFTLPKYYNYIKTAIYFIDENLKRCEYYAN